MFPLLDVQVVKVTAKGMHLVGYQIKVEAGEASEVVQGWWAKLLDGGSRSIYQSTAYLRALKVILSPTTVMSTFDRKLCPNKT